MINWSTISLGDLAGYLSEELKKKGIDTILVGGACVTIYSENRYQSYDLDFITYEERKKIKAALQELGFSERHRYFYHKECPWFIEFVSPPIIIGNEPIKEFNEVVTPLGTIKLLYPVDSVKDRLASFYYWNDKHALEQAANICQKQTIDFKELKRWSTQENELDKFKIFMHLIKQKSNVTKLKGSL